MKAQIRQAIVTKYLPPTNKRGARIKATCARGSLTLSWIHELDNEGNHIVAATALRDDCVNEDIAEYRKPTLWNRPIITGCLPSGNYCHLLTS